MSILVILMLELLFSFWNYYYYYCRYEDICKFWKIVIKGKLKLTSHLHFVSKTFDAYKFLKLIFTAFCLFNFLYNIIVILRQSMIMVMEEIMIIMLQLTVQHFDLDCRVCCYEYCWVNML